MLETGKLTDWLRGAESLRSWQLRNQFPWDMTLGRQVSDFRHCEGSWFLCLQACRVGCIGPWRWRLCVSSKRGKLLVQWRRIMFQENGFLRHLFENLGTKKESVPCLIKKYWIVWNSKFHDVLCRNTTHVTVLNEIHSFCALVACYFIIHFNIIRSSTSGSSKRLFPTGFPPKPCTHFSSSPCMTHALPISSSLMWWRSYLMGVQNAKRAPRYAPLFSNLILRPPSYAQISPSARRSRIPTACLLDMRDQVGTG